MSETTDRAPATRRRPGPAPWTWMIVACVLVAASGLVRVHQERLFADAARDAERPPFSLREELPKVVGKWEVVDHGDGKGGEMELEPQTLQIAGCSDYMYRQYRDRQTGVTLTVLVAFGPAIRVFPHSPDICFPANGYKPRGGPQFRNVTLRGSGSADADGTAPDRAVLLKRLAYGKDGGGSEDLREVYYTFWHDGRWDPGATATRRRFQHRPALFKVQVERPINPNEIGIPSAAVEDFLAALIPEIDERIPEAGARPGRPTADGGLASAGAERATADRGEAASE